MGLRFRNDARGKPKKLPRAQPPIGIEKLYAKRIRELVIERMRELLAPLFEKLPALLEQAAAERAEILQTDAKDDEPARSRSKKIPANLKAVPEEGTTRRVSAQELIDRGYYEPEAGLDKQKLESARKAIAEGQRDAVRMVVGPEGDLELTDGRHRLRAAAEAGETVIVSFDRGTEAGKGEGLIRVGGPPSPGRQIRELIDQARTDLRESVTVDDLERLAAQMMNRASSYNLTQLNRQTQAALGADVFTQDVALKPLTEAFVDANVGLVRDLSDSLANDIEATTMRAIQEGKLHGDLAEELEAEFGFAEDRAALIARDQIGKAYGQINAARQREVGVTQFIWRTVQDERVRSEHADRDGETYDYDDPPDGELPGEPINCRCYAEPVLDDILDELDDLDED